MARRCCPRVCRPIKQTSNQAIRPACGGKPANLQKRGSQQSGTSLFTGSYLARSGAQRSWPSRGAGAAAVIGDANPRAEGTAARLSRWQGRAQHTDAADSAQAKALVYRAVWGGGALVATFNHAGLLPTPPPLVAQAEEAWDRIMCIDVTCVSRSAGAAPRLHPLDTQYQDAI